MRIIEAQNAVLTNFEVSDFLQQRSIRIANEKGKRVASKEVENLLKTVFQSLNKDASPLSQTPTRYSPEAIRDLITRMQPYKLTKGEMIMLINIRPQIRSTLHCCIEEIESRLNEDDQDTILDAIAEVLGSFPPKPADGDEEMQDNPGVDTNGTS